MAQVAARTSEQVDHKLWVLKVYLDEAEYTAMNWDALDVMERLDFVHEWPLVLSHRVGMHSYLVELEMTAAQRHAYQELAARMERLQPFLDRVMND
jgi:hypothetical protein